MIKDLVWRTAFARWPKLADPDPGYTLLLPVPADLPVFLRLALANAARQEGAGRAETLVIPDIPSPAFRRAYEDAVARFAGAGPTRLVELKPAARAMQRLAGNQPGTNYFLQVHAGTAAATTTHVLFHDADLFIEDPGFMVRHYERCASAGLGCLGVSPAWDDWLREQGFDHVVATWELMIDTRWAREFAPWQHRNHRARLDGLEEHVFDVTLYTQALTAPERCALHPGATESFEHFNWVIGVYRHFQQAGGTPFEDDRFLLLLIRLLSDALDAPPGDVPPVGELARGIEDAGAPVVYPRGERYGEFRAKLDRVLAGPLFDDAVKAKIEGALAPFERAFAPQAS